MCAHFTTDLTNPKIMAMYKAAAANGQLEDMSLMMEHRGEVVPTCVVPVLMAPENYQPMRWGFPLSGDDVNYNARSEDACEKSMFRESMIRRRCAVAVTSFTETWKKRGQEVKYRFHVPGNDIIFLAGCWEHRRGQRYPFFTILTREAAGKAGEVHHRMPVILKPERLDEWLVTRMAPMHDPIVFVEYKPYYEGGSLFDLVPDA